MGLFLCEGADNQNCHGGMFLLCIAGILHRLILFRSNLCGPVFN